MSKSAKTNAVAPHVMGAEELKALRGTDALISFPVAIVWIGSGLVLGAVAAAQYRLGGKYRWRVGIAIASPLLVPALFTTLLAGTPA